MKGHLDAEVLAEYRAGLISGRRARPIAAHVTACTECAALDGRLAELSTVLAAAQVPAVPDAVARRLDLALTAEIENPSQPERPVVPPHAPRHGAGSRRSSGFALRVLAPAAAVLAVLAGGGYGLSLLSAGSSSSSSAATSGRAAPADGVASGVPSAAAGSGPNSAAMLPGDRGGPVMIEQSDVDYQPANLAAQLKQQLAVAEDAKAQHAGATPVRAQQPVAGCVLLLSEGGQRLLAQSARYRGTPVTVVFVSDSLGVKAVIAGPGCSATHSDILASVVLR